MCRMSGSRAGVGLSFNGIVVQERGLTGRVILELGSEDGSAVFFSDLLQALSQLHCGQGPLLREAGGGGRKKDTGERVCVLPCRPAFCLLVLNK